MSDEDDALKKGEEMAKNLPSPAMLVRAHDLLGTDASPLIPFYVAQGKGTIKSAKLVVGIALAPVDPLAISNCVISLVRYRSGSSATVASRSSGNLSVMTPLAFASLSNATLKEGDILGLVVTKAGAGLILPALLVVVTIEAG